MLDNKQAVVHLGGVMLIALREALLLPEASPYTMGTVMQALAEITLRLANNHARLVSDDPAEQHATRHTLVEGYIVCFREGLAELEAKESIHH